MRAEFENDSDARLPTDGRRRGLRQFFSRISIRLLAFNLLLVFLPVAGILFLTIYEDQLLASQERSMVQQGRLLSAALSEHGELDAELVDQILMQLQQRTSSRLRVIARDGGLIADSSALGPRLDEGPSPPDLAKDPRESWLYRIGSYPFRLYARLQPPEPAGSDEDFYSRGEPFAGPEVLAALQGRYGAETRISAGGQRSVTLYSAIPVRSQDTVVGVVLVSQSTFQILQDLYEVRLAIFKVFLASVSVAIVISLLVSTTIARPLRRLRQETSELLDHQGRLTGRFRPSTRLDEIGDLTRALRRLAGRLREHIGFIESFAADISHEFKNPLASIRSATEILPQIEDGEERERFLAMVQADVARMENLLTALREVTRIDARLEAEPTTAIDVNKMLTELAEGWRLRHDDGLELSLPDSTILVKAAPERFAQVIENLLDNATGFSPQDSAIEVGLEHNGGFASISVRDHGCGLPEEHLDRIFARFFSYRPSENSNRANGNQHAGLGLAIVKAIVEGYNGSVTASNHPEGGAEFVVNLPAQ